MKSRFSFSNLHNMARANLSTAYQLEVMNIMARATSSDVTVEMNQPEALALIENFTSTSPITPDGFGRKDLRSVARRHLTRNTQPNGHIEAGLEKSNLLTLMAVASGR